MHFDQYWVLVLLSLARTVSFIHFLPFFRGRMLPNLVKIAISLGIAMFAAQKMEPVVLDNIWHFFGLLMLEVMVGFILAYLVELMVSTVKIAGSFIDLDIGLSNPFPDANQTQSTVISTLFYSFFVMIFLVTGGLDQMFAGFIYSFGLDIYNQFLFGGDLLNFILETFTYMFLGALQIALPYMMATFLINLALLLMSKSVDKINILMNIFGVKILVGLALIFVSIPTLMIVFNQVEENVLEKFFEGMNFLFERRS